MRENVLPSLCCALCKGDLLWHAYEKRGNNEIENGVVWCKSCSYWYPIEKGLLELLPPKLSYPQDRMRFWEKHIDDLTARGLKIQYEDNNDASVALQKKQQDHFDWYSHNEVQDYNSYENLPFWEAVDKSIFEDWHTRIEPGKWLLDVGCAQGRSTFKFMNLPLSIVGFDISKPAIRESITRYRAGKFQAEATFFCADGSDLPFKAQTFDYVLIYGVLHHLPDPAFTCKQIAKLLKPNGIYFGSENNETAFRAVFDLLMKIKPLWYEEAGTEPLISAKQLREWFAGTPIQIETSTHVFIPPHFVNMLGKRFGTVLLGLSDWIGQHIPFVRKNGGLIKCFGTHKGSN